MLPDKSGIYKIKHVNSNKVYVGSALNFRTRWNGHIGTLRKQTHRNSYLQNAFNKYGEQAFNFEIIEYVDDKTKLIEREQYWIDYYKSYDDKYGYNISPKAGSTLGRVCTEETKQRIRESKIGKPSPLRGITFEELYTPEKIIEIKSKIIKANLGKIPPNKGKKLDPIKDAALLETFRIRELGNKRSLGHKHTEEAKEKNRQAHLGKPSKKKGTGIIITKVCPSCLKDFSRNQSDAKKTTCCSKICSLNYRKNGKNTLIEK